MRSLALALLLAIAATGCGGDVELPEAQPLSDAEEVLSQVYGSQRGSHSVQRQSQVLRSAERTVTVSTSYPGTAGRYPVVVFSHGNWSDQHQYNNIIDHWVSHGYVVFAPYHDDGGGMARGIFNSLRYGNLGLITRRVESIELILDRLPELQEQLSDASIVLDQEQIAITGHSFGAFTAQQFKGASAWDTENERWFRIADERVDAVVALSPPGPMFDEITADSWLQMDGPVLMTTGTWDVNAQFWPEWQAHKLSFDTAPPNDQLALVLEGADHYFGNLICRLDREQAPQHNALAIALGVSLAFLDAELKGNTEAARFLQSGQLESLTQQFARLYLR